ncbi:E3 ubiquitin-protein ligase MARCH11 [Acipenser ruthenus]|uniref:RING-type E3 ubiquitin transferase n=1 Tax=Acipenser ruthenus TaxID=7906 RepID=A0A444TY91_ACIRT|nr:E3 ubiquitin-protein ligase MARCH11 [Acipenser ruthenus]
MSFEAEADPVCSATEPDPQGGATISNQSSIRKHSTSGLKGEYHTGATQENEKDAREGSGVDQNPGEGRSGCGDAKDKCRCVDSGEKVQEESGESPSKADTSHSDCSSENSSPTPSCRICFQGAEQGELLNPCRCDGSWQAITITLVEKVQIIAVFLGSLFLVASVTWLLWSAFSPNAVWQRRDVLFQICYGMYGFMDLVCIGLIIHEGTAVYNVFKRWRAVNLHWDVQNYDKTTDVEENSSHGESSASRTLWLPLTSFRPRSSIPPTQIRSHRHHCGYSILHLCSRSTSQEDNSSGEVVIRVTSV